MDEYFPEGSVINISSGVIEEITSQNNTFLITVSYSDSTNRRNPEQRSIPPQTTAFEIRVM